jgi:hypothetical protein
VDRGGEFVDANARWLSSRAHRQQCGREASSRSYRNHRRSRFGPCGVEDYWEMVFNSFVRGSAHPCRAGRLDGRRFPGCQHQRLLCAAWTARRVRPHLDENWARLRDRGDAAADGQRGFHGARGRAKPTPQARRNGGALRDQTLYTDDSLRLAAAGRTGSRA